MKNQPFQKVGKIQPIRRSAFDLSHDYKTTLNMGKIYPVMCIEAVPSDRFKFYNEIVLRFQPMIAPILHAVDVYTHTFFVPYRLLWGSVEEQEQSATTAPVSPPRAWEQFISGGKDNAFAVPIPRWTPPQNVDMTKTLWDYFGYPLLNSGQIGPYIFTDGFTPIDFPRRAYNFIFNTYYRDQDLYPENPLIAGSPRLVEWSNYQILNRCWEKDYFTIARPSRQRGQGLAVPLTGNAPVRFGWPTNNPTNWSYTVSQVASALPNYVNTVAPYAAGGTDGRLFANIQDGVGTFDVSDLRNMTQLQKWQERNQRAGVRYKELIPAHFGIDIGDSRIDRPEYIGGTRSPVIVSEVLQTESTVAASPQGNPAGHGMSADTTKIGEYTVREYGLIMTLLSVRPRTAYNGKQLNRQWLRRTRYDFYWPEFAHLSEQAIYNGEASMTAAAGQNWLPWGYQGVYDELRYLPSYVTSDMRRLIPYWHLSRTLNSPSPLNWDFVKCQPRDDIFAVQTAPNSSGVQTPVDNLILNYSSRIKAIRPLPFIAEPGLLDHF